MPSCTASLVLLLLPEPVRVQFPAGLAKLRSEVSQAREKMPMGPKTIMLALALAVTFTQQNPGRPEPNSVPLPGEAAQVAREFLSAFSRNDRDGIKTMLPKRLENLYGPCPFARMPQLSKPRVDTRMGAIDFAGPMTDAGLPSTGTIVLRYVEEEGRRTWRVRQLYWYTELPPEAEIPDRSPTAADQQQEPDLRRAAFEFLHAWLAQDYARMDALTFHWWEVPRRPPKWVNMTGASVSARPTTLDGLRIEFTANLRVLRLIPKTVRGNLWMVKEDGEWKVRPLTFTFAF